MTHDRKTVSVIVAAWPDSTGLTDCLVSFAKQDCDDLLVIVVAPFAPSASFAKEFPQVQWLAAAEGALTPHLWARGIEIASTEILAITTAHFVAAPNWASEVRRGFDRFEADAIGGPIDPPVGRGAGAWATYLLRYSVQFALQKDGFTHDVAGDNAAYKRSALSRHSEWIQNGFWEPEFHRRLLGEGRRIAFVSSMRIRLSAFIGFRRFCAQRFHHGLQFGEDRITGKSIAVRCARIMTSPAVPLVLLGKICSRLVHRPSYIPAFLAALPALVLFIGAWSTGEVLGYIRGPRKNVLADKTVIRASI